MSLCRFKLPDEMYEQFRIHCIQQKKSISDRLRELVATDINNQCGQMATDRSVAKWPNGQMATDRSVAKWPNGQMATQSDNGGECGQMATNRKKAIEDILRKYNKDKVPEFDDDGVLIPED